MLNFGNKNSTCPYSNSDLAMGYAAATGASVGMGVTLRKLTAPLTKTASGKKLFFLNFLVGATASGTAGFCNTLCMRYVEIRKGIDVYEDEALTKKAGVSQKAAESAVFETAQSRILMSWSCMGIPTFLVLSCMALGLAPKGKIGKTIFDLGTITVGLQFGLPISISLFPPVS